MKPIAQVLSQEGFLKNLFESIPCGVIIVDGERRVQAANNVLERTFGIVEAEAINKRGGEALGCIHAFTSPRGCGFAEECQVCRVRNTALEAIAGKKIYRNKANIQLRTNGDIFDMKLLLSAAPFEHDGERLAIVILEDITELDGLRKRLKSEQSFAGIVGQDIAMQELYDTIRDVTDVNVPVLIQGESGTGKELVAAAIHSEGPRANKPFVPVNCGALPEGLLESELFGHVKGSFTGAIRDKKGRFELAHGGTLFSGRNRRPAQGRTGEAPACTTGRKIRTGVGDEKTISVDIRLISAASRDLKHEVQAGNFRDDLFYRINVVPIYLPPLRDRKNDIPLLVQHAIEKAADEGQKASGISKKCPVHDDGLPLARERSGASKHDSVRPGQIKGQNHPPPASPCRT